MKTEAVGTVTKSGGFSRVVREVEESNEPLAITRQNKAVAMVVPATQQFVDAFELTVSFIQRIEKYADGDIPVGTLETYLNGMIFLAEKSSSILEGLKKDVELRELLRGVVKGKEQLTRG